MVGMLLNLCSTARCDYGAVSSRQRIWSLAEDFVFKDSGILTGHASSIGPYTK